MSKQLLQKGFGIGAMAAYSLSKIHRGLFITLILLQETIYGISRPVTPAKLRSNLTAANSNTTTLKRKAPGCPSAPGSATLGQQAKRMHLAPAGSATRVAGSDKMASSSTAKERTKVLQITSTSTRSPLNLG